MSHMLYRLLQRRPHGPGSAGGLACPCPKQPPQPMVVGYTGHGQARTPALPGPWDLFPRASSACRDLTSEYARFLSLVVVMPRQAKAYRTSGLQHCLTWGLNSPQTRIIQTPKRTVETFLLLRCHYNSNDRFHLRQLQNP